MWPDAEFPAERKTLFVSSNVSFNGESTRVTSRRIGDNGRFELLEMLSRARCARIIKDHIDVVQSYTNIHGTDVRSLADHQPLYCL